MKKFNKITPEGTKDILFEECLSQRTVSERLTHIFKMRGYNEVITPGMEYYDCLLYTSPSPRDCS